EHSPMDPASSYGVGALARSGQPVNPLPKGAGGTESASVVSTLPTRPCPVYWAIATWLYCSGLNIKKVIDITLRERYKFPSYAFGVLICYFSALLYPMGERRAEGRPESTFGPPPFPRTDYQVECG